jgi:hypothetical protein
VLFGCIARQDANSNALVNRVFDLQTRQRVVGFSLRSLGFAPLANTENLKNWQARIEECIPMVEGAWNSIGNGGAPDLSDPVLADCGNLVQQLTGVSPWVGLEK